MWWGVFAWNIVSNQPNSLGSCAKTFLRSLCLEVINIKFGFFIKRERGVWIWMIWTVIMRGTFYSVIDGSTSYAYAHTRGLHSIQQQMIQQACHVPVFIFLRGKKLDNIICTTVTTMNLFVTEWGLDSLTTQIGSDVMLAKLETDLPWLLHLMPS